MPAPKKTILVVEDDKWINKLLCVAFSRAGFDAMGCRDGQEALGCMRRRRFDGVILDLVISRMDGFAVLEQRMHTLCAETPFFVATAFLSEESVMRAKKLGARRVISKLDCLPHEIVEMVQDELGFGESRRRSS
jgi:DNA-binding response OmpR family regulator